MWTAAKAAITSALATHLPTKLLPGLIAQLVARNTVDAGVASSNPAQSHTFVEIGHNIISTVMLLISLIQEGLMSVPSESMCTKYWLTA